MTWCPRCDSLDGAEAGGPCPHCGAITLDPSPRRAAPRGTLQVLETEPEAAPEHEAPAAGQATATAGAPPRGRIPRLLRSGRARLFRLARPTRGLAFLLVVGVLGATYLLGRTTDRDAARAPASQPTAEPPAPTTVPTAKPTSLPPLGRPEPGWLVAPAEEGGLAALSLLDGEVSEIELAPDLEEFAFSGRRVAFTVSSSRVLSIAVPHERLADGYEPPIAIASEVDSFSWTHDGKALVLVRTQEDARGDTRTRVELQPLDEGAKLLFETTAPVGTVLSRQGTHLIDVYAGGNPSVYEIMGPRSLRLVRRGVRLVDLSPDGERALVAPPREPGLFMLTVGTGSLRRIGPKNLVVPEARFGPDGRTVALIGTTNFRRELYCEGDGPCDPEPELVPNDLILWRYDVAAGALRKMFVSSRPDLSNLTWGPKGEWLFFVNGESTWALSLKTGQSVGIEALPPSPGAGLAYVT